MNLNKIVNRSLDSPREPLCCNAVDTAVPVALISGISSWLNTSSTNTSNERINRENREFASKEAEKQRDWQADEWTRQYGLQRDEWYKQLEAYQKAQWQQYMNEANYNKPVNQVARMQEAGLNPSAVLGGQGSSGLVSAASGNLSNVGSPSVPSGGPVSGAAASAPSAIPMQRSQVFDNIGSMLRDLAEASKTSKLTEPMVRYLSAQIMGQQLQNSFQETQNEIIDKIKDLKVKQAWADYYNSFATYALNSALYDNYNADTMLKKAERLLTLAKKKCSEQEFEALQFQVAHQFETWTAEQEVKKSQKVQNYASAGLSNALAKTEDDMRQFRVDNQDLLNSYQKLMNGIQANNYKVSDATVEQQIRTTSTELFERAKREGILTKEAQMRAEQAIKENDWWLFEHILFPVIGLVNENDQNRRDRAADVVTAGFSKKK